MEMLRPILELSVVIPGMLLACFPVKSSLKQPLSKLVLWLAPLLALLCAAGGMVCYARRMPTAPVLAGLTLLAAVIYIKTLRITLWKSGTVALSVCAVFACINSLCRAINAAMLAGLPQAQAAPWFCLRAVICYHAICWLFAAIAYYPATHSVRRMVEDENFAQTWYVFWVLPLVFIALNLFMIPKYADTLYTGRVLQGYFVISIALLFLMLFFNAIFLLMAISINRNVRLQQENQLLSMQQQRYESLKAAIEEARQARHDLRHQLCQLAALAEEGNLEKIKAYLSGAVSRIPSLELHFCENRAADGVVGHYCALAKREQIPFSVQLDLPECLPVDEINLCLVLSNLLENALEASLRTAPARRRIKLTAYLHGNSLALIRVENTYDGVIREKDGVFLSSKRRRRTSVRPSHCRKIRRGEYGYLSGRRIPRKGHALRVSMPCLSKTARPQISTVLSPASAEQAVFLFLQRYLTSLRPNPSGRRSRQLKIHNPVTVPARFRYNFLSH